MQFKPLFLARVGSALLFGSELKALLAHPDCPRELNWREIGFGSLTARSIPSFVSGIQHLPGGHRLVIEPGREAQPCAWWSLRDHFPDDSAGCGSRCYAAGGLSRARRRPRRSCRCPGGRRR